MRLIYRKRTKPNYIIGWIDIQNSNRIIIHSNYWYEKIAVNCDKTFCAKNRQIFLYVDTKYQRDLLSNHTERQ